MAWVGNDLKDHGQGHLPPEQADKMSLTFKKTYFNFNETSLISLTINKQCKNWICGEKKGMALQFLQNHQENVGGECLPEKHSHSERNCSRILFPTIVSSHCYSSSSCFSKLHLEVL